MLEYRIIGVLLLVWSGAIWAWRWAWMQGAFADLIVPGMSTLLPEPRGWPIVIATFAGVVGILFVLGFFPLSQAGADDTPPIATGSQPASAPVPGPAFVKDKQVFWGKVLAWVLTLCAVIYVLAKQWEKLMNP